MTPDATQTQTQTHSHAAQLRAAFDRGFTLAPPAAPAAPEDFLAIRVGGDPYVLRLRQVDGVFTDKPVVALPGQAPDLLGLASFRGLLAPVYDLGMLLGYPAQTQPRRWLLTVGHTQLALAFDGLDGLLRLPARPGPTAAPADARPHLAELIPTGSPHAPQCPLINPASVLATIEQRISPFSHPRSNP